MPATWIYWTAVVVIVATLVWAGASDWMLDMAGRMTITDLLRLYPLWFFAPAAIVVVSLVALALHLYLRR